MEGGSRPYSLEEGRELVWTARHVIEALTTLPNFNKKIAEERLAHFKGRHGVFVTIEHYPTKALRGCIGFTEPIAPMSSMLVEAAIAAASEDPRFVPVSHRELEHITIEVSVLTEPAPIAGGTEASILRRVKVGRDGLMVRYGYSTGLLLPIVAVEEKWNARQFLDNVCIKAGIHEHAWKTGQAKIYRFTTQVFTEREPRGVVEEVILK